MAKNPSSTTETQIAGTMNAAIISPKNAGMYLPASPHPKPLRIVSVETSIAKDALPWLVLVKITTEDGHVGYGETGGAGDAVASLIHDWMAERLLGEDALAIESHWRFFYERCANVGVRGAEIRAISAIDVALWDILGKVCNQPIYRLLGGPVRSSVPTYNSCGNPLYGRNPNGRYGWPGYGSIGEPGPLSDSYNFFHNPVELVTELKEQGYKAMKVWCFDEAAHRDGGMIISNDFIKKAIRPLEKIREAHGDSFDFMIDGHGFFMLPAALRIAEAMKPLKPLWLEDIIKMDNIRTLADFRRQSGMPISASEMLLSRADYLEALILQAADYIMIDPTWAGGISETARIAHIAQGFNIPSTMHDCTGPLTVFAGIHVNASVAGCCYQETVRAHIKTFYKDLIDELPEIKDGQITLPQRPGLGVNLNPDLFTNKFTYRKSEWKK
ncbi:MAG: mandelate racemase/muconate lactonizing enzyme family protein [Chthoniobacterales bacterium]